MLSCLSSESFKNSAQETENKYFVFFFDTEFVLEEIKLSNPFFNQETHCSHFLVWVRYKTGAGALVLEVFVGVSDGNY